MNIRLSIAKIIAPIQAPCISENLINEYKQVASKYQEPAPDSAIEAGHLALEQATNDSEFVAIINEFNQLF